MKRLNENSETRVRSCRSTFTGNAKLKLFVSVLACYVMIAR